MNERHRIALERGLAEFDRVGTRRRTRRRAVGASVVAIAVTSIAFMAVKFGGTSKVAAPPTLVASRPLPPYVEIITDDGQLNVELELASACERVGRSDGRMYVVECTRGEGSARRTQ